MGLLDKFGQEAEHAVGDVISDGSRAVGAGLNSVGEHGAARTVETAGNRLASDLGAESTAWAP